MYLKYDKLKKNYKNLKFKILLINCDKHESNLQY